MLQPGWVGISLLLGMGLGLSHAQAAGLAAATLPRPINPEIWVTNDDYPQSAFAGKKEGIVKTSMDIDKDGKVYRCTIVQTSGTASLDEATCKGYMKRARFKPALDASGTAIPSSYAMNFRWRMPASPIGSPASIAQKAFDLLVTVAQIPSDAEQHIVYIWEVQNADGRVEDCGIRTSSGSEKLDRAACRVSASAARDPLLDAQNQAVRSLRPRTIAFAVTADSAQ